MTAISLFGNKIGDDGAKALADALKVNSSVTDIDLTGNNIGADGTKALADALKVNASVIEIDLAVNNIGTDGAKALADALKVNFSVISIDLEWNYNIGADGKQAIEEINTYLQRNKTMHDMLLTAVLKQDISAVKDLLNKGINVRYKDKKDHTAFDYAIQTANFEILYLLLTSPRQIPKSLISSLVAKFTDKDGNTLLHQAALFTGKNPALAHKLIESLLSFGANRYVKNLEGQYPFELCTTAAENESTELNNIRHLLSSRAEQLFMQSVTTNQQIEALLEKLSTNFLVTEEIDVTPCLNDIKQIYQLPGELGVRLLFEELEMFYKDMKQDDFQCEAKPIWLAFLEKCLSAYEKMTNAIAEAQHYAELIEPKKLSAKENTMAKELILTLQQINQLIFQHRQASPHRDKEVQEIHITAEWVEFYGLELVETKTNKKRKRETEDLPEEQKAEQTTTVNAPELPPEKDKKLRIYLLKNYEPKSMN